MKITAQIAALLLVAIPAMVAAAPVASNAGSTLVVREVGEVAELNNLNVEYNDEFIDDFDEDEDEEEEEEEEEEEIEFGEEGITQRDTGNTIFVRATPCSAVEPDKKKEAAKWKTWNTNIKKMKTATYEAKKDLTKCDDDENKEYWDKNTKAARKNAIVKYCIAAYDTCVKKRIEANNFCLAAGAKSIDAGHLKAVEVCRNQLNLWKAEPTHK